MMLLYPGNPSGKVDGDVCAEIRASDFQNQLVRGAYPSI
jgi:hypothetical protein